MTIKTAISAHINEAAASLQAGEAVVIPTETVYGVAANALNDQAVQKIFNIKNRPSFNPLIVHVLDIVAAEKLGAFSKEARKAASHFWPGALTVIVPKRTEAGLSDLVTAGLETVALRVPAQKTARAVLKECGLPLAAPSANASGEPSATTPQHAAQSLGERCPMILADGVCPIGLESTVVDFSSDMPTILRPGAITQEALEAVIGPVAIETTPKEKPKSPGQLLKHYAPSIPVRLQAVDVKAGEALLAFGSLQFMGVEGGGRASDLPEESIRNLSESGDLEEAARNLFRMMRELDQPHHKAISVMDIPKTGIGLAINERLERAAKNN